MYQMEYWSRTGSSVEIASFLLMCLLWGLGGLLIVSAGFHLKSREKLVAGLAAGFVLFIELGNLLVRILPFKTAYWLSAGLLAAVGVGLAVWARIKTGYKLRVQVVWSLALALVGLLLVFILILRGLAIFDDYYQLPLISVMATGDIPPHFYLNSALRLPYHYGLQVFAASLVRMGGLYPWSAWDISRAIVLAFAPVLGWLWIRRETNSSLAAWLGAILLLFGGGSRWLLLFVPQSILNAISPGMHMDLGGLAAGGNLLSNLTSPWPVEGGGPFPFPYAFASGILEPLNMNLGATGALWEMTVLLLLLLIRRRKGAIIAPLVIGLLVANLALSAEQVFVIAVAGMLMAIVLNSLLRRAQRNPFRWATLLEWGIPLGIGVLLAVIQGGFISDGFFSLIARLRGQPYPLVTTDFQGFGFRWPLAMPSGHFGPLSLFNVGQVGVLLAEAGPALLLLPIVILSTLRKLPGTCSLPQGLALGSLLSFFFPIFFRYGLDFDITRLVGAALWLWYALSFPVVWRWLKNARKGFRFLAAGWYAVAIYTGLVMFAVQLISIPVPQTTYYLQFKEPYFSRAYWNRLEKSAQILDDFPERAVMLFGRASFAGNDVYARSQAWKDLIADPDPVKVASAGYSYVYMDGEWWERLTPEQRTAYKAPCVHLVDEQTYVNHSFRKLLDVKTCRP